MPSPQQIDSLDDLIHTATPVVVLETHEEKRVVALFSAVCKRQERALWTWSAAAGLKVVQGLKLALLDWKPEKEGEAEDTKELPAALQAVAKMKEPAVVLLLDVHPYLSNPLVARGIKELALQAEPRKVQLALVGHEIAVPEELVPYVSRFDVEPMTLDRVKAVFNDEIARHRQRKGQGVRGDAAVVSPLTRHLVGLPESSVRHLARLVLGDGEINTADLARVLHVKKELMGAAQALQMEHRLPDLDDVAGMAALKRWLAVRREPFLNPDAAGLPPPRGVLLLGVQGAGKSLAAKAIGASWQVPVFRMDFGALFDKYQGESERKLREALRMADAMQPCVLWMDEIEKGLATGDGGGDGTGAGQRMLGCLLTWMAERRSSVFLVATANNIEALPPELMRKGRFDEIFFVDLPGPDTRAGIFKIHLAKHQIAAQNDALAELAALSEGYAGAEIEAAVVAARYEAHAAGATPTTHMVAQQLIGSKPLSVTRAEAIDGLRAWAADRTVGVE
jgi:ATPase family associated with various cellular activities (AAA)